MTEPLVAPETDGVRYFRQSWVNTALMCPEQGRLDWYDPQPDSHTDATAIGTALHAGIETALLTGKPKRGATAVVTEWQRLEPDVRYVQVKQPSTALGYATNAYASWHHWVYPQLSRPHEYGIEQRFRIDLDDRVGLSGTWDFLDETGEIWDWKTGSRPYERWEKERFAVQPTAYAAALVRLGLATYPVDFTYAVHMKQSLPVEPQILTVTRTQGHEDWLVEQLHRFADMLDATDAGHLQRWPLNDQGWWCSAKWCSRWGSCKGAHL